MDTQNVNDNISAKIKWTPFFRQLNVFITVWCFYFTSGLFVGTPTVFRPQMIKQFNSTTVISENMFSWITSIGSLSGSCCIIILILLAHFCGRKKTTVILSVVMLIGSVVLSSSHNALHILIVQLMYGILVAGVMTVFPMMITEYSSTKYRGIFLTLRSATFFWGIWTANAIGIFTHYRYIGILALVISSYAFITSFFIKESPYWLAAHKQYDECVFAHRYLKGDDEQAERELEELMLARQSVTQNKERKLSGKNLFIKYVTIMKEPEIWKPVALSLLIILIYDLSGKYTLAIYAIQVMKRLTGDESAAHIAVLVLDGFSVLGMYIGCGMSNIFKRRIMLLVTSVIGITFLFVMSSYLYLIKLNILSENSYVITALLIGYSLAICSGPMIMSACIFGELLPLKARSFCICVISSAYLLLSGILTKIAPYMFEYFGIHGSFLAFGISCSIAVSVALKFLPETKDRSLYEIANAFKAKRPERSFEIKLLKDNDKPQ